MTMSLRRHDKSECVSLRTAECRSWSIVLRCH